MTVVSMKTNDDKRVELEIKVGAEEFKKAVDEAFRKNAPKITIPGFRKGKAPRKMIEQRFGEGVFYEDAINDTYPAAYEAAMDEKGLEPVDRPNIEVNEVSADGYTFKATVFVKPEVQLDAKDYKGVEVEKVVPEVTEEEIQQELVRNQERSARMVTVEDRAAKLDDIANINFEGFVDGVAFEGGKGEDFPLQLGSGSFIPGFEDQVVGKAIGEEFDVNVTFPEDYQAEELKGKAAVFKCKLNGIQVRELPEIDDEFAKDISEFDTLDELKADIKKHFAERKEQNAQTEVENKLMEAVCGKMGADIPQVMYENRIDDMVRDFEQRLSQQGMQLDMYLQYTGMELESFRKTFAAQAEGQVKTRLALEKIVENEKFEITEEDFNKRYEEMNKEYNVEIEQIKKLIPESGIRYEIGLSKALDFVVDNAKIKEVAAQAAEKAEKPKAKAAAKPKATKATVTKAKAEKDGEEKPAKAAKPAAEKKPAKPKAKKETAE